MSIKPIVKGTDDCEGCLCKSCKHIALCDIGCQSCLARTTHCDAHEPREVQQ
jgi:hypothetical protein